MSPSTQIAASTRLSPHDSTSTHRMKLRFALPLMLAPLAACDRGAPQHVSASTTSADASGVTIARNAPQWRYVELGIAAVEKPLPPLPVPGHVELAPDRTAALSAPLPGRVERVLARRGASVNAGERLLSIRSGALAELIRDEQAARADLQLKQRAANRLRELHESKAAAHKDLLVAEAELQESEFALLAAQSKLASLAVEIEGDNLYWVTAPRSGVLVEVDVLPGLAVGPERAEPLMQLSDLDEVLVVADVAEGGLRGVEIGQSVSILSRASGESRRGSIESISRLVDPRRRTVEVWVRAPNADHYLRPNAFVEVALEPPAGSPSVVCVPDAAVVTQGTRSVVFVPTGDERLEPRAVQTGRRRDGRTEISSGLEPGSRYVARGALLLLNAIELAADQ